MLNPHSSDILKVRPGDNLRPFSEEERAALEWRERAGVASKTMRDGAFPLRHLSMCDSIAKEDAPNHWRAKKNNLLKFIEAHPRGSLIALIGPRGTGKTQLAVFIANQLALNPPPGRTFTALYARTMEFLMAVKDSYSASTSEQRAFERFIRPDFLVLDEVQVRNGTEWERSALTYLIDSRYASMKNTVLISNEQSDAFTASMGDSVMDRLTETGTIALCDWESFRG